MVAYAEVPAHELLRAEAARFHGVPSDRIVLGHECPRCGSDEHGRPVLRATAALRTPAHVSLSRAGALSVVALTEAGPVGVDVEAPGAAEFAGFDDVALAPGERAADRTRAWVRKEAVLKALGLGLALDPRDVVVDGDGRVSWASAEAGPDGARLQDLDVPGHVVAVAVLADPDADLRVDVRRASL